jgi:hypothetical protein
MTPAFRAVLESRGLSTSFKGRIGKGELGVAREAQLEEQKGGAWDPRYEDGGVSIDAYLKVWMIGRKMSVDDLAAIKRMFRALIPADGNVPGCPISGLPFTFASASSNAPSLNRHDNKKGHTLDNIEIIGARFNVRQDDAIENIQEAWVDIFARMCETFDETPTAVAAREAAAVERTAAARLNFDRTPKQNALAAGEVPIKASADRAGYDKQISRVDLSFVIGNSVDKMISNDAKINGWAAAELKAFKEGYGKEIKRVLEAKAAEPGPGSHDPKFLKQQTAPAFSFGSARQHGPVSISTTPGPGRYDH